MTKLTNIFSLNTQKDFPGNIFFLQFMMPSLRKRRSNLHTAGLNLTITLWSLGLIMVFITTRVCHLRLQKKSSFTTDIYTPLKDAQRMTHDKRKSKKKFHESCVLRPKSCD